MKILSNNPYYSKALKRESEFWEGTNTLYQNELSSIIEFEQLQRYGNKNTTLHSYFKQLGKFNNVLSIGSGDGSFEFLLMQEGIIDKITFIDISESAINKISNKTKELGFESRVKTIVADLNFLILPENKFDFICCLNVLHHVINLEECIFELNKSLKGDGSILIDDFIGENKMQWQETKIIFIEYFKRLVFEKFGTILNSILRSNPKVLTNNCPFECIRSSELYNIVNYYYGNYILNESVYGYIFNLYGQLGKNVTNEIIKLLIEYEEFFIEIKELTPTRLFGIYKKTNKQLLKSELWSEKEVKDNIGLSIFNEKKILKLSEHLRVKNYKMYEFLKKLYFLIRK